MQSVNAEVEAYPIALKAAKLTFANARDEAQINDSREVDCLIACLDIDCFLPKL